MPITIAQRLVTTVLNPMKQAFIEKDEIIDLMGVALVAGENLFLLGPPGTAKSALVQQLGALLGGKTFDYLLTRFTEPNELFGPFDIRRLREGELITNTEGMLPEASLVFLDELLNANSALLNSLLTALNERVFRRGRETKQLPALLFVGASNHLPEEEALRALFDRFLLRAHSDNVPDLRLEELLNAGWQLQQQTIAPQGSVPTVDELRALQNFIPQVDMTGIRVEFADLVRSLRKAGLKVSDRRAVKLQRVVAASALLSGRTKAQNGDLWVFRHIWDSEDQVERIASLTGQALARIPVRQDDHPRSREAAAPNPEALAQELNELREQAVQPDISESDFSVLKDRLSLLESRLAWITDPVPREALIRLIQGTWQEWNQKS